MAITSKQQGFALIIVLSLSVVLITVLSEIMFQTEIESRASVGERNRINAESAAISGAQFANMLFVIDASIPAQFKGQVETMLGGKQIFQMLDDVPIGSEALDSIKDLSKVNLNSLLDGGLLEGIRAIPGNFVLKTTDENAKLNINLAIRQDMAGWLFQALKKLFSTPREKQFLEEKGYKPERLAANLIDYVDPGDRDTLEPGADENLQYEQAKLPHKAKNGPLQSMEELRRVPGFNDDEIYNLFTPYLTVWPTNPTSAYSLNVNSVPTEAMAAFLSPENGEISQENFDKYEDGRAKKQAEDIKDVNEACTIATGTNKCPDFLANMAVTKSTIFKVEIEGVSAGISRTLTYVFDRGVKLNSSGGGTKPTPSANPPAGSTGSTGGTGPKDGTNGGGGSAPQFKVLYKQFR